MNRYFKFLATIALVIIISGFCFNKIFLVRLALSQEVAQSYKSEATRKASDVVLTGEIICLGCSLKKEQGAKAQCTIYGHKNALKTEDGKIWTILENDVSTELINSHDYTGKKVEVIGKKFAETQVIEIESFKVIE